MPKITALILAVLASLAIPAGAGAHGKHHAARHSHHPASHALRHHRAHKADVEEDALAVTCTVPEADEPLTCLEDTPTPEEWQAVEEAEREGAFVVEA